VRKNVILICVGLFMVIGGIGFYFTPHIAVYNMKKAADNKDVETLSDYVDYPAFRESLKANFNAMMASEVAKSKNNNLFEALGAALAAAIINPMIDSLVTPESLAMLMKGEKPQMENTRSSLRTESSHSEADTKMSMEYDGINRFVVKVKGKDSSEDPVKLIFKRKGIISWKLSALRLPTTGNKLVSTSLSEFKLDSTSLSEFAPYSTSRENEEKSKEPEQTLVIPSLINKRFQRSDFTSGIYEDAIWIDVSWDTSHLKKPTRAIKGILILCDIFGESKLRLRWTLNQPLTPGTNFTEKGVGFEYNQFIDSHKWVRATDLKDMTFKFEVTDIIFQDKISRITPLNTEEEEQLEPRKESVKKKVRGEDDVRRPGHQIKKAKKKSIYFVLQIASYREKDRANKEARRWRDKGYRVKVRRADLDPEKGIWYRVYLGEYRSVEEATNSAKKLAQKHNLRSYIVPICD